MLYCGDQLNFTDIWIDEGINQCILDTITSGILFLLMFICGCLQCSMYRKYSTQVDTNTVKGTVGFTFQVSFLEKKQKQKTTNKQKTNDDKHRTTTKKLNLTLIWKQYTKFWLPFRRKYICPLYSNLWHIPCTLYYQSNYLWNVYKDYYYKKWF